MVQRLQTTQVAARTRGGRSSSTPPATCSGCSGCRSSAWRCSPTSSTTPLPPEFATDKILPYFMSLAFPRGAVGLVIAAILAASLSSIDSAINSCTSVVVVDFYNRLVARPQTAHERSTAERAATGARVARSRRSPSALPARVLAMNVSRIGSLLEIANKLINAFTGPLFGIYLLAMFSRRATSGAGARRRRRRHVHELLRRVSHARSASCGRRRSVWRRR